MATRISASTASQLAKANELVNNSLSNADVSTLVAQRGYTTTVLAEGQRHYNLAVLAVNAQAAAAGSYTLATRQATATEKQAQASFQRLVQTVRAVFPPNSAERKTLDVAGPMLKENDAFIGKAITLFGNAHDVVAIALVLARYGYDEATLRSEQMQITAFQEALLAQTQARSAAKRATRAQNEALGALQAWVAQYTKIARIALRGQPELLAALGISTARRRATSQNGVVPSNGTP